MNYMYTDNRTFVSSVIEVKRAERAVLQLKSFIIGNPEYMDIWVPTMEDEYQLKREPGSKMDPNAVMIVHPGPCGTSCEEFAPKPGKPCHQSELGNDFQILGHVPKLMVIWLSKFLKRGTNDGKAVVKGKRINRGGRYGLDIPCKYHFTGDKISIAWLESKLDKEGFELK